MMLPQKVRPLIRHVIKNSMYLTFPRYPTCAVNLWRLRNSQGNTVTKAQLRCSSYGDNCCYKCSPGAKGRRHAFLVTKGFRDLLRIGYQSRPRLFDLDIVKPEVLFSEVHEIDEWVTIEGFEDFDGTPRTDVEEIPGVLERGSSGDLMRILKPLDEEAVKTKLSELRAKGIDTIAICFAHSHIFGPMSKGSVS